MEFLINKSYYTEYEAVRKAKDREWWKVEVSCSDYDSINTLSRVGYIMLMILS